MFNKTFCHTYIEQNYTFLCSSDDHNDKNLYSLDNAFDILAAAAVTVLSPIAVVKNGLVLATIWRRNFARTSLHIFLNRLAMTDLLGDLISGPLHALRIFFPGLCTHFLWLFVLRSWSFVFFVTVTIVIMALMSFESWMQMSRRSFKKSLRTYYSFHFQPLSFYFHVQKI